MNQPAPADILAAYADAFVQSNRLLKLRFSPTSGIAEDSLLAWQLKGREGINRGYRYELTCLSADAFLALKQLLGQALEISLLTDSGVYRPLSGFVTQAQSVGADGGMSRYVLVIEDLFAVLARRFNNRVFQSLSAKEAVLRVLEEHRSANSVLAGVLNIRDLTQQDYPQQSWITQYNESDTAFIQRKLFEEGINYYFEYGSSQSGSGPDSDSSSASSARSGSDLNSASGTPPPQISLVLFDDNSQLTTNPAATVRYHRADGTEDSDSITQWHSLRQLAPAGVAATSYDYKSVALSQPTASTRLDQGEAGAKLASTLEDYRHDVSHYGNQPADYERYTGLRMAAYTQAAKQFSGESTVRAFTVGSRFQLSNHPEIDSHEALDREFVLTEIALNAVNNLPPEIQAQAQLKAPQLKDSAQLNTSTPFQTSAPVFENSFTAQRHTVKLVPPYRDTEHAKPTAPQLLSATVVGPAGEEIYTDELGRIRVNLHFPRSQDHTQGGASQNETDSVWLRVNQAWAGTEYGALFIPRIGDEVLISFIGGDIDRPIVTGTVYNGSHAPATFSHTGKLPGNKSLSGIKSKMYKGTGANELLLDDSTNEQRVRLATDHGKTELNQGYLVHPRSEGKGTPRGEGFELRSDMAGAIRAGQGLLLTTDSRQKAQGSQLDRQELLGQLETALSLAKQLAELSTTHHAEDTDTQAQNQLLEHIQHWEQGSNTDKEGDKNQGGKPVIAISGQAGIALSTPQAMTVHTGTNLDIVTSQDTSITTGRNFKARAANLISLFSHKLGMKLIAASGKIEMQAQSDNIEMTSAKKINLSALEEIILQAPKITIVGQGAGIDLGGNQILSKTQGAHTEHAGKHVMTGPASPSLKLPNMPKSELKTDEKFVVSGRGGQARERVPYQIAELGKTAVLARGQTAGDGGTDIAKDTRIKNLNLKLKDD